jgi:hypothetical protein
VVRDESNPEADGSTRFNFVRRSSSSRTAKKDLQHQPWNVWFNSLNSQYVTRAGEVVLWARASRVVLGGSSQGFNRRSSTAPTSFLVAKPFSISTIQHQASGRSSMGDNHENQPSELSLDMARGRADLEVIGHFPGPIRHRPTTISKEFYSKTERR